MHLLLLSAVLALSSNADPAPRGRYVEARTATVFAGACHYGSEYTTVGREAVLGVHLDAGVHDGQPLAGLELVAVVRGTANLAERDGARESVVFVPAELSAARRTALVAWAREELSGVLGRVVDVRALTVDVELAPDGAFRLAAGEGVQLSGNGMPDRECCTMPFGVWYRPLVPVAERRVGFADTFRVALPDLGVRFARDEDNCAFTGYLGRPPQG